MKEMGYTPKNLSSLMKKHRLNNGDVAKLLGCDVRTVQRWLSGDNTMNHWKWCFLNDLLKV